MKDVRNVKLHNTMSSENLQNPAANIYSNWDNGGVSKVAGHVDANFRVDLRGFSMPTPSRKVTSNFGYRWGRNHDGLDIKVYVGDTIKAAFDGKVRVVRYDPKGYGYYVVIRHPNGLETLYGHLSKQLAKVDQIVRAGEPIGLGGNTGRSFGSHLHFETRLLGKPINPAEMFDFANQDVTGDSYTVKLGAMTKGGSSRTSATRIRQEQAEKETSEALSGSSNAEAEEVASTVTESENKEVVKAQTASTSSSKAKSRQARQKSVTYKVKDGDNLYNIARRHNTTVSKLCKLNGLKSNSLIHKGQVLKCS